MNKRTEKCGDSPELMQIMMIPVLDAMLKQERE